jgi:ribosome-associated translation inhibitor RaiA
VCALNGRDVPVYPTARHNLAEDSQHKNCPVRKPQDTDVILASSIPIQRLESIEASLYLNLCSPIDPDSRRVLLHSYAAVLANSQHEPFGLVGLETMAAAGVACLGSTGGDYAMPGYNALVLETNAPQEFLDLFGALRANPSLERAVRRAGRATAQHFTWSQIMRRILLPRLGLMADASREIEPSTRGQRGRMRLHIEGCHTNIPAHLLGWIAERLEQLNTPHDDILQARVTLIEHKHGRRYRQEARVELTVAAETLSVMHIAATAYEAVYATLKAVERKLRALRNIERVCNIERV